jgi:hypothetical protein
MVLKIKASDIDFDNLFFKKQTWEHSFTFFPSRLNLNQWRT